MASRRSGLLLAVFDLCVCIYGIYYLISLLLNKLCFKILVMHFQCFNRISFRREYDGTANWQLISNHLAFVVTRLILASGLATGLDRTVYF